MKKFLIAVMFVICLGAGAQAQQITGSTKLTVATSPVVVGNNSLLHGCTVDASNTPSCSIPGGWMLVVADGAEAGFQAGDFSGGTSQCTAGTSTSLGTTVPAHTGSHSYCGEYTGDGTFVAVMVPIPNGPRAVYVSYWDRVDPQGTYGNSDYIPMALYSNMGNGPYVVGYQAQYFGQAASTLTDSWFPRTQSPNESFWYNGPAYNSTIDAGTWVQYELLVIPDTSDGPGSLTGSGIPPPNCTSPSQTACGNGTMKLWVNGNLVSDVENANLVNADNILSQSTLIHIGDYMTSFGPNNGGPLANTRCQVFDSNGGGTCPGTQPGTGGPKPFYRYIDDIIVMKQ